jgi:hypothetical protein
VDSLSTAIALSTCELFKNGALMRYSFIVVLLSFASLNAHAFDCSGGYNGQSGDGVDNVTVKATLSATLAEPGVLTNVVLTVKTPKGREAGSLEIPRVEKNAHYRPLKRRYAGTDKYVLSDNVYPEDVYFIVDPLTVSLNVPSKIEAGSGFKVYVQRTNHSHDAVGTIELICK